MSLDTKEFASESFEKLFVPSVEEDDLYFLRVSSTSSGKVPPGWTQYTHPQGWVYFRHDRYRIVTDEDIRDLKHHAKIISLCERVNTTPQEFHECCMIGSADIPLLLYINHAQCIASYDYDHIIKQPTPLAFDLPLLIRSRRMYYNYLQHHPTHQSVHSYTVIEALDAVKGYLLDHLVSGSKIETPFSKSECGDLMQMLQVIRDHPEDTSPSATSFVAWLLKVVYIFRHRSKHCRYTKKEFTEMQEKQNRPPKTIQLPKFMELMLSFVINVPFFGIPKTYLEHTKIASEFRGRLDDLQRTWERYTSQLTREYSDFVLASTVLLSATMGFLAVPDIEQVAKALGIISVFASLCSIAIGVFFIWRHHRPVPSSTTMAYIHNARNNIFGLPGHAVLLSLPPAFLVWSIITFAAAVLAYTLQNISVNSISIWIAVSLVVTFFLLLIIGLFIFSNIWGWRRKSLWPTW
ncbi:hypothetical protein C8Q75DRAFT_741514 [Abortiporus biennis]|nr:hypothetical protein C8Q75DRAFT_741514 [Abortiporus biennis]